MSRDPDREWLECIGGPRDGDTVGIARAAGSAMRVTLPGIVKDRCPYLEGYEEVIHAYYRMGDGISAYLRHAGWSE